MRVGSITPDQQGVVATGKHRQIGHCHRHVVDHHCGRRTGAAQHPGVAADIGRGHRIGQVCAAHNGGHAGVARHRCHYPHAGLAIGQQRGGTLLHHQNAVDQHTARAGGNDQRCHLGTGQHQALGIEPQVGLVACAGDPQAVGARGHAGVGQCAAAAQARRIGAGAVQRVGAAGQVDIDRARIGRQIQDLQARHVGRRCGDVFLDQRSLERAGRAVGHQGVLDILGQRAAGGGQGRRRAGVADHGGHARGRGVDISTHRAERDRLVGRHRIDRQVKRRVARAGIDHPQAGRPVRRTVATGCQQRRPCPHSHCGQSFTCTHASHPW